MNKKKTEEEHVVTDREKRAWQANKGRKPVHERPKLDRVQRIKFLELISQMASRATLERELGLTTADVESYKQEFDIESPDEARRMARRLKSQPEDQREAQILEETQKARDAEKVANERLDALDAKRQEEADARKPSVDVDAVRREDADRQRRFAAQQADLEKPTKEWRLPMEQSAGSEYEQIDRFRRDLIYHGFRFVARKYRGVTKTQIKWEAARLGLKINWDIVRG